MLRFEEYITEMEARRMREKYAEMNATLAQGLQEKTYAEAVEELYKTLTFVGGVSDICSPMSAKVIW